MVGHRKRLYRDTRRADYDLEKTENSVEITVLSQVLITGDIAGLSDEQLENFRRGCEAGGDAAADRGWIAFWRSIGR